MLDRWVPESVSPAASTSQSGRTVGTFGDVGDRHGGCVVVGQQRGFGAAVSHQHPLPGDVGRCSRGYGDDHVGGEVVGGQGDLLLPG
ncbi:hypothetical protein [Lentzea cavernae]|nr:hypothetical protein [Lentzea cavernae]